MKLSEKNKNTRLGNLNVCKAHLHDTTYILHSHLACPVSLITVEESVAAAALRVVHIHDIFNVACWIRKHIFFPSISAVRAHRWSISSIQSKNVSRVYTSENAKLMNQCGLDTFYFSVTVTQASPLQVRGCVEVKLRRQPFNSSNFLCDHSTQKSYSQFLSTAVVNYLSDDVTLL